MRGVISGRAASDAETGGYAARIFGWLPALPRIASGEEAAFETPSRGRAARIGRARTPQRGGAHTGTQTRRARPALASPCSLSRCGVRSAGTGTRTRTGLPPQDFKSRASTTFAIPADGHPPSGAQRPPRAPWYTFARKCETGKALVPFPSTRNQSGKRDSNPRPQPWQGCALPTELFPRDRNVVARQWDDKRITRSR